MTDKSRPECDVWDRFLSLLYPSDESMSIEEIDADLALGGIDIEPTFRRVQQMLETQRARARMLSAKDKRESLGSRIRDVVAPKVENLRESVKERISKSASGKQQLAYFHKLEDAATEEDLQSLFDDLEKLAALRELNDGS
jgi:predicted DNA-binding protein YlxM (UPF0122 family)